ncbi:MAG: hypothetical protein RG740_05615, partial [Acholeplasmataceae bacterium]|nr:hypothetical protein [Acholeplasmataceae bacterium]
HILLSNREYIYYFTDEYNFRLIIFIIVNIFVYRYIIKILLLRALYEDTKGKVAKHISKLFYILVVGPIGTGKTKNTVAIAQMVEMDKINQMNEKLYKINTLLHDHVNFPAFNAYIIENYNSTKVYTDEMYRDFVYRYFKGNLLALVGSLEFESFKTVKLLHILAEYVEIFYCLHIRGNHILSNTTIKSINTGNFSLPIKESFFQIYRKNVLANEKYLVQIEDEKGVVDNSRIYARMDTASVKENDDGKDVHGMLQRHGSKGTSTYFVISQTEKDITANRRRLPNRFIELLNPMEIYIFKLEMTIINYFKTKAILKEYSVYKSMMHKARKLERLYRLRKKEKYLEKAEAIYQEYMDFLDQPNKFKKRIKRYERINIFLGKYVYNIQYVFLHESEERIGKKGENETVIRSSFPMMLAYPLSITYGNYDQHALYELFNSRNKAAKIPLSNWEPFKREIMTRYDFNRMDYRAFNRIFGEVDAQQLTETLKPPRIKLSDVKPSEDKNKNNNPVVYDIY